MATNSARQLFQLLDSLSKLLQQGEQTAADRQLRPLSMFGSRLHSAAISENGPDHETGGGMSADEISCVLRR